MDAENRGQRAGQGIGRRLERAREARGLSYREIEESTRIRSRYLRDLERENFDVLPAVYVLGSLKTYADFLGLDGAALSQELKGRLEEPTTPDLRAGIAAPEDTGDDDGGPGIFPVIGFDQLFLGAGVIMISILAIMTLVAAVAQENESPVSEINEPSTPDVPAEIALAGTLESGAIPRPADGAEKARQSGAGGEKRSQTSGEDRAKEDRGQGKGPGGADNRRDSRPGSIFGDVEFVRMPSAPQSAQPAAASTSAGSGGPAPAAESLSGRGASPGPSSNASATASPQPRGDASPGPTAGAAPSQTPPRGGAAGREPGPVSDSPADRISAGADQTVGQALANAGIER